MKKKTALKYDDKANWARLISTSKRQLDHWSQQHINMENGDLKLSFMAVIFNISPKGDTNTELSKKSMVAKQAMSRSIKELEEKGLVTTIRDKNDKRSYKIHLTEAGKQFVENATTQMSELIGAYIELVGSKKFKITLDVLGKINAMHEKMNAEAF